MVLEGLEDISAFARRANENCKKALASIDAMQVARTKGYNNALAIIDAMLDTLRISGQTCFQDGKPND